MGSIQEGLKFTILAVVIAFAVLIFLGFILEMFRLIFYHPEKKEKPKEAVPVLTPKKEKEDKRSKLRKIAAIAAALSAYEEAKIRLIRPTGEILNFWRVRGIVGRGLNFWRVKEIVGRKVSSKIKTKRWKNG